MVAVAVAMLGIPAGASAALLGTYTPSPADLNDLDHHMLYTWRIQDTALIGKTITSATLTFTKMFNWDTSGNVLYTWLLNNANLPGAWVNGGQVQSALGGTNCTTVIGSTGCVMQFTDDPSVTPTLGGSVNDFGVTGGSSSSTKPGWLVSSADMATARDMTNRSFAGPGQSPTTSPGPAVTPTGWSSVANGTTTNPANGNTINAYNYTYTFSAGDLSALNAFLADDVFALGLDPDCHYYNNGITLTLYGDVTNQGALPEPATLVLLGTGLAFVARRRLMKARA